MLSEAIVLNSEWEPREGYSFSREDEVSKRTSNGNLVWRNPKISVEEVDIGSLNDHQVLIEVKACGICGSDLHFLETDDDGYMLYPGLTQFPCVIGHEFSGRVIEKGSEVLNVEIGDLVAVEEMQWCGRCTNCRTGNVNQCSNLEELGFTVNGAMSRYIIVDEKYCWNINSLAEKYGDETLACEVGSTIEPTGVAYNGIFVRGKGFKPGGDFLCFGAGPIGLAAIQLAKAAGANNIIIFDVIESRLELARQIGFENAYNINTMEVKIAELVNDITKGNGVNFVLESSGVPEIVLPEVEDCLAVESTIAQIGRAGFRVPLSLEHLQVKASQIVGVQGHSGSGIFPNVIRLMESGRIDNEHIITNRYDLSEAHSAFEIAGQRQGGKTLFSMK